MRVSFRLSAIWAPNWWYAGTPISLTSAGKVFLLYAREQRQAQQDMIRQIGEVAGGGAGVLKVGISHTRGSYLMPKVIHRLFRESCPRLP